VGKVYRGRFWQDNLWLLVFPGLFGAIVLVAVSAGVVAIVTLTSRGEMTWNTAALTLAFLGIPGLGGGWACFYVLLGGLGEWLQVQGDTLVYRAPLLHRRVPIRDILIVHRWPQMLLRYRTPRRVVTLRLPNWSRGRYADEFIGELTAVNPDIELVVGPMDSDQWGDKLRRLKEAR
jgi:hypothetical protein